MSESWENSRPVARGIAIAHITHFLLVLYAKYPKNVSTNSVVTLFSTEKRIEETSHLLLFPGNFAIAARSGKDV
jgi:hypothetical protein